MDKLKVTIISLLIILSVSGLARGKRKCDESLCATAVSQCLSTGACEKNVVDCARCLGVRYYVFCCVCLEICPVHHVFSSTNYKVELFDEALTNPLKYHQIMSTASCDNNQWEVLSYFQYKKTTTVHCNDVGDHLLTCTVAYNRNCMCRSQCRKSCLEVGAEGYRWFDGNGCCECFGHACPQYGMSQNRCTCYQKKSINYLLDENIKIYDEHYGSAEEDASEENDDASLLEDLQLFSHNN